MGSAVDRHRHAHDTFNKRDWTEARNMVADKCQYEDRARNLTLKSGEEFVGWLKEWATGLSDAKPDEPTYIDGGEYSIALFKGRGTHDGQFGPLAPSGRRLDLPFCEVLHYDKDGKIDRGEIYYDQLSMLVQLGAMDPPKMG